MGPLPYSKLNQMTGRNTQLTPVSLTLLMIWFTQVGSNQLGPAILIPSFAVGFICAEARWYQLMVPRKRSMIVKAVKATILFIHCPFQSTRSMLFYRLRPIPTSARQCHEISTPSEVEAQNR